MTQPWLATSGLLQINAMPFYWRLSNAASAFENITQHLPIRVVADERFDYLKYEPSSDEWTVIDAAYRQNENIGFLNPESGQASTYGTSVNNFFLATIQKNQPASIFEIGCGAGHSIQFLKNNGFDVTGVDPSEYSLRWSERLGFNLINDFFREDLIDQSADLIYCNDVFEHIRDVVAFSKSVYKCLANEGIFCFATTNSTESIALGDISMLEHQHVNMFTDRSIQLILREAGFSEVEIKKGNYGNTFHVVARKLFPGNREKIPEGTLTCSGYFEKASKRIESFNRYYMDGQALHCYVPLRCIPYLATVGDYGNVPIYDSNQAWRGKFIDGYNMPIRALDDVVYSGSERFFIGSLTFYDEISRSLTARGYPSSAITSIRKLS